MSEEPGEADLARLDAEIARWQAERDAERAEPKAPLWLSHHYRANHGRCRRVGNTLVCRRCLVLWPLALGVLIALNVGTWWPESTDPALVIALALPGVIEFVADNLGWIRYSPRRQLALSVPVAFAIGRLLDRYLADQTDPVFWTVVVGYGAVMGGAAVIGQWRSEVS
jgi:hypothetical protein